MICILMEKGKIAISIMSKNEHKRNYPKND